MNIDSAFQGLSASHLDIYQQIGDKGWSVKKVKFDKKEDCFVAIAQNAAGEEIQKTGDSDQTAIANLLIAVTRRNHMRTAAQQKIGMWKYTFTDQMGEIAEAYAKAPTYDPKAAIAFKELADDCTHRAKVLEEHLQIQITPNPEPYLDSKKMMDDIHKRRRLQVSSANASHPLWTAEQVIAFRICFDVLGYAVAGSEWDWRGDNLAFAAFAPLVSANAQQALFSEVIGQSAYAHRYRAYGPQKVAIMREFIEKAQEEEGVHPKAPAVHPSQSFPPVPQPSLRPFKPDKEAPHPVPHHGPVGLQPLGAVDPGYTDPNFRYQSGVEPMQPNAYLDHADPLEYQKTMANAKLTDTEWSEFKDGEGKPDYERMKLAIVNAFRVAILSPQKLLAHNAVQYQHIMHIPAGVTDPAVYWKTLDQHRMDWNVSKEGEQARHSHRTYWKYVKPLANILHKMDPTKTPQQHQAQVEHLIEDWNTEEQNTILDEEAGLPEERRNSSDEVERKAYKTLTERMKTYIAEYNDKTDISDGTPSLFEAATAPELPLEGEDMDRVRDPLQGRYAGFMGSHMRSLAQISQHADELLKAALEDVKQHKGAGWVFRSTALQLKISGVNSKVASFAWLLLQPMTSELATIDRHILAILGYGEKDLSNRDYFKGERELQAGRDAAGYEHMPLGAFQWSMWDNRRTGEGTHQDHSALKVVDPTPYDQIDWRESINPSGRKTKSPPLPDWWEATKPFREQVGEEWDENQAREYGRNRIPYTRVNQAFSNIRTADKHQLDIEWDKRKPITMSDAKILGEYAAGVKLDKNEAEDYLQDHKDDIKPQWPKDYSDFKKEFLKWFDRYHQSSMKTADANTRVPWFTHPVSQQQVYGQPGETIMSHATKTLRISTPEVWAQLAEAGKN